MNSTKRIPSGSIDRSKSACGLNNPGMIKNVRRINSSAIKKDASQKNLKQTDISPFSARVDQTFKVPDGHHHIQSSDLSVMKK
jgi:hypothetical protein